VWKKHGGANQRWSVLYLDKAPKTKTEGFNKEFGFYINRPFYIRSRLPMKRLVEMHGNNNMWIRRWENGRKAQQQWVFD